MKNAPTTNCSESAPDKRQYTPGELPKRKSTVLAEVLACMLDGRETTGMSSVFAQSTTRLAAVIHALEKKYGWQFDRRDVSVSTKDGRIAWITAYRLPNEVTAIAKDGLVRWWIEQVYASRHLRRVRAEAKKTAHNGCRKKPVCDPRQLDMWE